MILDLLLTNKHKTMFSTLSQIFTKAYYKQKSLIREDCFNQFFINSLSQLDMDEECPGCESGIDYHGAHLVDGEIHSNCCSLKI